MTAASLLERAGRHDVNVHQAIALRYVTGPAAALSEVDQLGADLQDYHLFHATRAELLRDLDRPTETGEADRRALARTANPPNKCCSGNA